jgi:hypothetical protein
MGNAVYWDVASCSMVSVYLCFTSSCYLVLKVQTTRRHNPEVSPSRQLHVIMQLILRLHVLPFPRCQQLPPSTVVPDTRHNASPHVAMLSCPAWSAERWIANHPSWFLKLKSVSDRSILKRNMTDKLRSRIVYEQHKHFERIWCKTSFKLSAWNRFNQLQCI